MEGWLQSQVSVPHTLRAQGRFAKRITNPSCTFWAVSVSVLFPLQMPQCGQTRPLLLCAATIPCLSHNHSLPLTRTATGRSHQVMAQALVCAEGWLPVQVGHRRMSQPSSSRPNNVQFHASFLFYPATASATSARRFMNGTVTESTKPRGVVDLSKVQDVSQASKNTGKQYSFMLKTASSGRCGLCRPLAVSHLSGT